MNASDDRSTRQEPAGRPPTDPVMSRRRFARGGFAATALLGSLPSTPVLGQDVFYNCTLSGKLSGNMSHHGVVDCTTLGRSPDYWRLGSSAWPAGFIRGRLPDGTGDKRCEYSDPSRVGTLFRDAVGVDALSVFPNQNNAGNWNCKATTDQLVTNKVPATMLQALNLDNGGTDRFDLCAVITATLLNVRNNPQHVLTEQQVKDMFQQVYAGGMFNGTYTYDSAFGTSISFNRPQLIAYLRQLYQP